MDGEPLAIVGMGCRFPGADSLDAYWQLLATGGDAVRRMPAARARLETASRPLDPLAIRARARYGGFLDDPDQFDAAFFGISPREAERLDPQQRILLETAWHALDDAGYVPTPEVARRTGVFVGMWLNDYESRLFRDPAAIDFYMTLGSGRYSASGRLSFFFGFDGPSLTLDTACSSSLVAVHEACASLRSGECEMALAGGVNVILEPSITIAYTRSQMLSPDGRCKFGDDSADGYVRSDGAGVVVLKRLSRAVADGDRIHAIIRGSAVNSDGRSNGFLATPAQEGQEEVLRRAYANAGVAPGRVQYVEAHGTGTRAGDPVELSALAAVLREGRTGPKCRVGSVKSNIGHTEGAAGIAGLIKVALALEHDLLPPTLHVLNPTGQIDWGDVPLELQTIASPWPDPSAPPLAGVSSFGISGTNAHVVLEAHAKVRRGSRTTGPSPYPLVVTSHTRDTLDARVADVVARLQAIGDDTDAVADLCYTADVRSSHQSHRCVVSGRNAEELHRALASISKGDAAGAAARGVAGDAPGRMVFVFPGQGSQWVGMGRDLFANEPAFRQAIEQCDEAIRTAASWSLIEELHAETERSRIDDIDVAQPMLCAMEIALARLWTAWGIRPDAVVGHSMGEIAAAHIAGVLTLEDAVLTICRRSALLRRLSGRGAMAVVELSVDDATAAIVGFEDRLAVAVSNSRRSTVLSGDPAALDAVIERLERRDVFCRLVRVDVASHSPQMDVLQGDLARALKGIKPTDGSVPFYSTVQTRPVAGRMLDADYWVANLRQPVLFARTVSRLIEHGYSTFIEMSPHPLLVPAVGEIASDAAAAVLSVGSTRRNEPERSVLLDSAAQVFVHGHAVNWSAFFAERRSVAPMPPYRWAREPFWYDAADGEPGDVAERAAIPGSRLDSAVDAGTSCWEFRVSLDLLPALRDHVVLGRAFVPAAFWLECLRSAAADVLSTRSIRLEQVVFDAPLIVEPSQTHRVQIVARADRAASVEFQIFSTQGPANGQSRSGWTRHARCRAMGAPSAPGFVPFDVGGGATDSQSEHDARMQENGLHYGPSFRSVREVVRRNGQVRALLRREVGVVAPLPVSGGALGPELLDGGLQALLALAREGADPSPVYVPAAIASIFFAETTPAAGELVCEAERTHQTELSVRGDSIGGRLLLRDDDGVRVEMRGVRFAPMLRQSRSTAQDPDGFRLEWMLETLARADSLPPGVWLLLADSGESGDTFAEALAMRGGDVIRVTVGQTFEVESPSRIRVRPAEGRDFDEAVRLASDRGALVGVVDCLGIDERVDLPVDDAAREVMYARWTVALMAAQACARAGVALEAGVAFVTAGENELSPPEATRLKDAPIAGLSSVIRAEHPELRSAVVDIGAISREAIDALASELAAGLPADRVAFRTGRRYVVRVCRAPLPDVEVVDDAKRESAQPPYRIGVETPGNLDTFDAIRLIRPRVRPHEIEIEVEATGLNFMNLMSAMGIYPGAPTGVGPLGIECAGRVVAVGSEVADLALGDEVIAVALHCLATHAITDARLAIRRPSRMSVEQGAAFPIAFLTAHYALNVLAGMRAGERVLIHSATGGVGLAALQLARRAGAEIIATAGSEEKRAWLRQYGVRHVFDSRAPFGDAVREATGGGVDVVLNSLAGAAVDEGLDVLRPFGRMCEIGKRDMREDRRIGLRPFLRNLSYFAIAIDRLCRERPQFVGGMLRELSALVECGALEPLPTRTFEAKALRDAFREFAQARHTGKLAIRMHGGPAPYAAPPDPVREAVGGTVLITGGYGALGLAVASWLVDRGITHLALVGRTEPGGAAREVIGDLEARGAVIHRALGDVGDASSLAAALDDIRSAMPPLSGIVHAAGVLDDATLLEQQADRFVSVMRPKVDGAMYLDRLTADDPIHFFVLMSSVASFLGVSGQSNYAAANAFLDAFAADRRRRGRPALSVGWGPWAGGGLAARADRGDRLAEMGLESLDPSRAVFALERLLRTNVGHAAVMAFDVTTWRERTRAALLPSVARLAPATGAAPAPPPIASAPAALRSALTEAAPGRQRRQVLEKWLRDQLASVLRVSAARVEASKPFRTLGLDSLMGLEFRNRIEAGAGISIPATAIWNFPTLAQLTSEVASRMGVSLDAVAESSPDENIGVPVIAANDDELAGLIEELEQLSEEEARRLIRGDG